MIKSLISFVQLEMRLFFTFQYISVTLNDTSKLQPKLSVNFTFNMKYLTQLFVDFLANSVLYDQRNLSFLLGVTET